LSEYDSSRRSFLSRSVTGLALASLPGWYAREVIAGERERAGERPDRVAANDQINIACIGTGGSKGGFRQGLGVTRNMAGKKGVKVVAVCDVDKVHREEAAKGFGPDCKAYNDFRSLLQQKDIDAVVIGTPDHWHTAIAIAAMRAGKDVYCEKPLTLFVEEGRAIARVQQKTGRVFQVGSQQRSDGRFRLACELVRNGRIGKIRRVEARLPNGSRGGPFQVKPVPADLDWDMWLGPAPWTEYIPERTHGSFRHWYEYSGGMMTDWGAHHLDITQWALGADDSGPIRVEAAGLLPANARGFNTPVDFEVTYTYPNNIPVIAMSKGENGVRFEGESGWIFVSRGKIEASEEAILKEPLSAGATRLYESNDHIQNFVDCVRSRKEPICTAEIGHRSATVCHLGNISLRMGGRALEYDPVKETFPRDEEATELLSRPYRKPWKLQA
jgi:myo-inositol 2-dehydrogenase / D-chiro-inositol 1-dehydrogenase